MERIFKLRFLHSQIAKCIAFKCLYMYLAWKWPMWFATCCF